MKLKFIEQNNSIQMSTCIFKNTNQGQGKVHPKGLGGILSVTHTQGQEQCPFLKVRPRKLVM